MNDDFIRVTRRRKPDWTVVRGPAGIDLLTFRVKAHAVAYGRAVSHSGKMALFVDDQDGTTVRQETSSLTYPRKLN